MAESKFKCMFEVAGKILEIGETQTFGSGFQKRAIIIEASKDAEKFSNPIEVTLKKDGCAQADSLRVGDFVEVTGFVEGRAWEGPKGVRHFVDLSAKSLLVTARAALPTKAVSWEELLKLGEAYGEGKDALVARCKALGKAFKAMSEADWQKLADNIVAEHATDGADEADDFGNLTDDGDIPF